MIGARAALALALFASLPLVVASCSRGGASGVGGTAGSAATSGAAAGAESHERFEIRGDAPPVSTVGCDEGKRLSVHFYDVGQALAALVDLPDGRHVLVDAGDAPHRGGCEACAAAHEHLLAGLRADLHGAPLDLVWTTHPHSDHVGGMASVLATVPALAYVDNGRGDERPEVRAARAAAAARGAAYVVVDPEHAQPALPVPSAPPSATAHLAVRAVVPPSWPAACDHDENECSIGLRIDFCRSSILFTGDAEREEEARLDPLGPATLLQVGHHGSDTSTSARFLAAVTPRYAVVSAGHRDDERNREYCHPRALAMRRLSRALGGSENARLEAFSGSCVHRSGRADDDARGWSELPVSGRLFATERDGDVVLTTTGDGNFARVSR